MRILAVIGSPKRGNTYRIVSDIEEKMKELSDSEFEYLFLGEANLAPCRGCYTCITRGEDACPLQDDREAIGRMMLSADGVIFASPNYVSNVSGLMKTFIDRFAFYSHRPAFYGKHALAVATSAGPAGLGPLLTNLSAGPASWGFEIAYRLGVTMHPTALPSARWEERTEHQVEEAARFFAESLTGKAAMTPEIWRIVQFASMKANAELFPDDFPADYDYYQGRSFYSDARIGGARRLIGWLAGFAARRSIRKDCRRR
jgi:NAD(P)H-dependent FMN reductase